MKVRVRVTAKNIRDGVKFNGHHCPVALALGRLIAPVVSVGTVFFDVSSPEKFDAFRLSGRVRQKIRIWDHGRGMSPFSFTIDLPKRLLRKGVTGK